MKFEDIAIGMSATTRLLISEAQIEQFAHTSGDFNPIHLDATYAKDAYFGRRIAHGMLPASLFSGLFGTKIPGPGCLYVGQNLRFRRPVYLGDQVEAVVQVIDIDTEKRVVAFDTKCFVAGETVIFGTAELFVPLNGERSAHHA